MALALATLAVPGKLEAQTPVRLLTFNIRYGTANDGEHSWPNRRHAVMATIRDHAPHLLGVQEALRFQLDEIAAAVSGYREIGVGREDGVRKGEYAALLVDTARFTVVSQGTFWLSDTPEVPNSMHWGNRVTRITTWARLLDRVTGDTLRVYNLHWDHESQASRERSAALLESRLRTDGSPSDGVLVMGDFNSGETNPAFRRLAVGSAAPLRDTFRALHAEDSVVGTFNSFRGDSTGEKIDAILTGGRWAVLAAGIERAKWSGILASDHFGVWALVERVRQ